MSISDLEKEWFDYTIQFVEKLNENDGDWQKLHEEEQELAALWRLEMDVHNGGFLQFFTNWGFECYQIAIRALEKIGARQSLRIVQAAYDLIDKYKEDARLTSLQDLYKIITREEMNQLDILDNEYWELPDNIAELTFKTYKFFSA